MIFRLCGFKVQNVELGIYKKNNEDIIVSACEDFTNDVINLAEFQGFVLSDMDTPKNENDLYKTLSLIESSFDKDYRDKITLFFWDMFVIDALIGNTDRHNGNWGILYNKENNTIDSIAPIYDCGSSLSSFISDEEIETLSKTRGRFNHQINNAYSVIKIDNKRINYKEYILNGNNKDLDKALLRVFDKINIEEINNMIDNIDVISDIRKIFYKEIIKTRYKQILKKRYDIINTMKE